MGEVIVGKVAGVIFNVNVCDADPPQLSVTVTVTVKFPLCVGVPVIWPVEGFMVSPVGCPLILQVTGEQPDATVGALGVMGEIGDPWTIDGGLEIGGNTGGAAGETFSVSV